MSFGLADYFNQGISGPGIGTMDDVLSLRKAMELTSTDVSSATAAGRILDVQAMLKYTCLSNPEFLVFFNQLPKAPLYDALSTVDRATSNGTMTGGFSAQGELPPENDGTYERSDERVKFMTTIGAVTDPRAAILSSFGNVMEVKVRERLLYLAQRINHYSYFGDADLILGGGGAGFEFNGVLKQMDAANVTDCAGSPLDQIKIDQAVTDLIDKFGNPKILNLSNKALHDYNTLLGVKERIGVPMNQAGIVGSAATGQLTSTTKNVIFAMDRFLRGTLYASPSPSATATSPQAPNSPASVTAAVIAATTGDFEKGDSTGLTVDYAYAITLGNRFGESVPVLMAAPQAITNAQKTGDDFIRVTVTNPAVIGPFEPNWIGVYRTTHLVTGGATPAGVSSYSLIRRIAVSSVAAGGVTTIDDLNLVLPFTEQALLWDANPEEIEMKQLLPTMMKPLADVSFAKRFGLAAYITPHDYTPTKQWRFFNIGAA